MSIVWSLKRLFDPGTFFREEAERRAERDAPRRSEDGDPPQDDELAADADAESAPARCRVCGREGRSGAWCLDCLADTMERVD